MTKTINPNINSMIRFPTGHLPDILKKFESCLGMALSLRSTTGEVVCKTDYFNGPCSIIRGTERGRQRCRKTYQTVENRLLRRKVPFVNICYAGFLIFAVPLEFRGEMVGTLLGAQILPVDISRPGDRDALFGHTATALGISDQEHFYRSFQHVKMLKPDFQRVSFMEFLTKLGDNFLKLAMAETTWSMIYRDLHQDLKPWEILSNTESHR